MHTGQADESEPYTKGTTIGAHILSCTTILVDLFAKQVESENSDQLFKK